MSRLDPKNREEAFAYQFEDCVKLLRGVSPYGEKEFEKVLGTLEAHILAYRSTRLKNDCKKVEKRNKEIDEYMKKHHPALHKITK